MSIEVKSVTKLFGSQKALDNVSFSVATGEIAGFLGPNGAGKSTMMKIITGFIPASSGTVLLNGEAMNEDNPELKRKIGYLPENNPLYPEMYIREYLGFVASVYGMGKRSSAAVNDIIEITGLTREQNKKIGALSKGYRQRVGLAQALIHDPEILILDEATTGLDPNQIVEIRNLIMMAGKNKTVLLSTHIMQEVEAICNRVMIIDKGTIIADENKSDIYSVLDHEKQVVMVEFDRDPAENTLESLPYVKKAVKKSGTWIIEADGTEDIRPMLFSFAVSAGIKVVSLRNRESNLEDVFRQLTSS